MHNIPLGHKKARKKSTKVRNPEVYEFVHIRKFLTYKLITLGRTTEKLTESPNKRSISPVKLIKRVSGPGSAPFSINPVSAVHIVMKKIARPEEA